MTLPGIGVVLAIGTALAGVLYLLYQQSNQQNQHTYGGNYDRDNTYYWQPEPLPEPQPSRNRANSRKRKSEVCSICLENSQANMKTLDCDHSFHKHCIDTWLLHHNSCPNCRKTV